MSNPRDLPGPIGDKLAVVVRVTATNDGNGNPRRGWQVYHLSGHYLGFMDEGYQGERGAFGAIVTGLMHGVTWSGSPAAYLAEIGHLKITPGQYRELNRKREMFPLA